ncbi:citrate lyase holo-[acyl-carrier protein] synthase [Miniphocaeibacter halophilus]|uniref:Citrate lyase holo-[acyl-carrier protein] synthase n=1 Tax=Miniphocaeibacter halophilus TaxID=2931922 RepID=A0AC61MRN7_9FIRM|nr:citrate lyase holo-[acyl-carrier protein] synthase [Miniphocaeibacter halophilus]QQK08102.1 citrate lyase holo-[acyl-carrier protein] synthase [Miniphocaeibacter halophilus]
MKNSSLIILNDREKRWNNFNKLINSSNRKSWIIIRANIPGNNKTSYLSNYLCYQGFKKIIENITIKEIYYYFGEDGLNIYFSTNEDSLSLKKKTILIEEQEIGRFIDVDVIDNGGIISRTDLNYERRKCYICDNDAIICVKKRKHSVDELIKFIEDSTTEFIFKDSKYIFKNIFELACIIELSRTFSYGCVNVIGNGSHSDMDLISFFKSIKLLGSYYIKDQFNNIKNFKDLRNLGKEIEKELFKITKGINTYKGLNFLVLFVSYAFFNNYSINDYSKIIKKLADNIYDDFNSNLNTNGYRINEKYNIKGIREIPYTGFEIVENIFCPYLKNFKNIQELNLIIMKYINDTTTINRCGIDQYYIFKNLVSEVINKKLSKEELDRYCLDKNISTGGAADIIIITIMYFLIYVYEEEGEISEINKKWNLWKFTV